jgi:hypothetical protein
MPHDVPHGQTAYQTVRAWRHDGTWLKMHAQLRDEVRTRMGRHPQPSAAMIAAQTVKTTEQGGSTAMMVPRNSTDHRLDWTLSPPERVSNKLARVGYERVSSGA